MSRFLVVLPIVAVVAASCVPAAQASPVTASVAIETAGQTPAVGPAYVDSFSVSCTTTAAFIAPANNSRNILSYSCQNTSTTKVAVGDSGIADPTDAQNSPTYCQTNCPAQEWGGNAKAEYCRADTGTVTIYCRALVAATAAP